MDAFNSVAVVNHVERLTSSHCGHPFSPELFPPGPHLELEIGWVIVATTVQGDPFRWAERNAASGVRVAENYKATDMRGACLRHDYRVTVTATLLIVMAPFRLLFKNLHGPVVLCLTRNLALGIIHSSDGNDANRNQGATT